MSCLSTWLPMSYSDSEANCLCGGLVLSWQFYCMYAVSSWILLSDDDYGPDTLRPRLLQRRWPDFLHSLSSR